MGGDGANGLALAIFIASLAIGLLPAIVLALIGRRVARTPGLVAGALLGLVIGPLAVVATFFESTWSPPIALTFTSSSPLTSVALVPDPNAAPVVITGPNLPLVTRRATVDVPKTGVVHVRDLLPLRTEVVDAFFNGARATGMISNQGMVAFDFGDPNFDKLDPAQREAPPVYPAERVHYNNTNTCGRLVYKRGCAETRTGRVVVRVTIDAAGKWRHTEVVRNTITRDPELVEKCVLDQLPGWTYEPPGDAPPSFELTFIFGDKC